MEPCGTPKLFESVLEGFLFSITNCCLFRKDLVIVRAESLIPLCSSLNKSVLWLTESKVFLNQEKVIQNND